MAASFGSEPPLKRAKLLSDDDDSDQANADGVVPEQPAKPVVQLNSNGLKINKAYAERFEHNKKREELHRLGEKYNRSTGGKRNQSSEEQINDDSQEDESSTSDSEDDDAALATADLDQEILATLNAIKSKDPRVYDKSVRFYKEFDEEVPADTASKKEEKPLRLHDYHRQNLLAGYTGDEVQEEEPKLTYQEEQDQLKRDLVGSMHAAAFSDDKGDDGDDEPFLVAKSRPKHRDRPTVRPTTITGEDVKEADKDPETYLSNFMAARAWLPAEGSHLEPFESDDSEDDARADAFEEAYNMRFEDPQAANEKLQSFARDVGKYGIRRPEKSGRQKARDREREKKDAEKQARAEEKARLRKLKIEQTVDKVKRIKEAAGMGNQEIDLDAWKDVIEGDFDDETWEREMSRRFGDDYYAKTDDLEANDDGLSGPKDRKHKKPKWKDDIDIKDIIPDFDTEEKPAITLSSDEDGSDDPILSDTVEGDNNETAKNAKTTKKQIAKDKADAKRAARRERMKIEELVDASLPIDHLGFAASASSRAPPSGFFYRDTSPTSFGLSARDILFADDSQLNQYAGLKKLAAFRDTEKKRRDKKKYSKKARLRQWRKETFGKPDQPVGGFETILGHGHDKDSQQDSISGKNPEKRKKRRGKRSEVKAG